MTDALKDKIDPIRATYFEPLEKAERLADLGFYSAAVLSVAVLIIDRAKAPHVYAYTHIAFLVAAIAGFVVSIAVRVYFSPRAQDVRFSDFLSSAFGVRLGPERTKNYYTTDIADPIRKAGAQALENVLFTKEIARRMCRWERSTIAVYLVVWLCAAFNHNTAFDIVIVASQVVFSEQLISRAVRLEWLRGRSEAVFSALYQLLQTNHEADSGQRATFEARIIQEIVKYENTKSNAALTLSSRIFERLNPSVSATWEAMRTDLHI